MIASTQTHGVGRAGRAWHSASATGLYCSILLRPLLPSHRFQGFSIAVGLALCEALDADHAIGLRLKWPNDLLYADRKLAGILIATSLTGSIIESAVLGIGLNLLADPERPGHAIALAEIPAFPTALMRDPLPAIVRAVTDRYNSIVEGDRTRALAGWESRLAFLGQPVEIRDAGVAQNGIVRGIDERGALVLETDRGMQVISAGELTRGPRQVRS